MVELESEGEMARSEVAAFLREFANEIDEGILDRDRQPVEGEHLDESVDEENVEPRQITFIVGGDSATVTVPDTVEFDVEVGSRSPMLSSGVSQEIEFELSWEIEAADEHSDDRIEIG